MRKTIRHLARPLDPYGDGRVQSIYRRLTEAGHEPVSVTRSKPNAAETVITGEWSMVGVGGGSRMVSVAAADLRRCLRDVFGVALSRTGSGRQTIRVAIDPEKGRVAGQSKRDHVIEVGAEAITITGVSEWGAACGLYHVQRLLKLRLAPVLPRGDIRAIPRLEPSITCLAFKRGDTRVWDYPVAYHDNYLIRV
ncbi:MAG: hypothetical protein PHR35_21975, partial [Kiritimatiellae bacterium]|nr:hypothetical protein [Kiritimatiellia bacterium]